MTRATGDDRLVTAAFVTGSLLAGGNAVAVRFSNRELDPMWGAGLRFSLAAILLFALMAMLRLGMPRGRALIGALLYGVFNFAAAFGLAYYGLVRVHAGLGQTVLALVPWPRCSWPSYSGRSASAWQPHWGPSSRSAASP